MEMIKEQWLRDLEATKTWMPPSHSFFPNIASRGGFLGRPSQGSKMKVLGVGGVFSSLGAVVLLPVILTTIILDSIPKHLTIIILICWYLLCFKHCIKCFFLISSFHLQQNWRLVLFSPHCWEEKTEMLKKLPRSHSSEMAEPRFSTGSVGFQRLLPWRISSAQTSCHNRAKRHYLKLSIWEIFTF